MKLVRYSKDVYQILNDAGDVAYLALRLANDKWGAYDGGDIRLTKQSFDNPRQVRDWIAGRDTLANGRAE